VRQLSREPLNGVTKGSDTVTHGSRARLRDLMQAVGRRPRVARARELWASGDTLGAGLAAASIVLHPLRWLLYRFRERWGYLRARRHRGSFVVGGKTYDYFHHSYGLTYQNERAVELPVVWDIVQAHQGQRILEVGNVLSHYFRFEHVTVDKYEWARGVLNADVVDYQPEERYDLIVSISTLEHVGWDEAPRDPEKVVAALQNLDRLLAPGGTMVITIPLGYNPDCDRIFWERVVPVSRTHYLARIAEPNTWAEVSREQIREVYPGNLLITVLEGGQRLSL
jgi:hypothetical protein